MEFDGSQHLDAVTYDEARTRYLQQAGWQVIRFWNGEVLENPDGVVEAILAKTAEYLGGTHPQLLPSREGRTRAPRTRITKSLVPGREG